MGTTAQEQKQKGGGKGGGGKGKGDKKERRQRGPHAGAKLPVPPARLRQVYPEINYDDIEMIHGMDVTFVTSATRDDHAMALLKELGMPFKTTEDGKRR